MISKSKLEDIIQDKLDEKGLGKMWDTISDIIGESFLELMKDEEDALEPDLDELLSIYVSDMNRKRMLIEDTIYSYQGNESNGYSIDCENKDNEWELTAVYAVKEIEGESYVTTRIIEKLREMAYIGYDLVQPKECQRKVL